MAAPTAPPPSPSDGSISAAPQWVDVVSAREALGLGPREFLHAGPPVEWADASGPVRGALAGAMIYEGLAESFEEAAHIADSGGIALSPCHSRGAVGPMAGVVSASMPVSVIEDPDTRPARLLHLERGPRQGAALRGLLARGHRPPALAGAGARAAARPHAATAGPGRPAQHHRPGPPDGRRVPQPQPRRHLPAAAGDNAPTCSKAAPRARTSWRRSGSSTATTISS